jgi:phage host-nuclease inhibitor protein Gam
MKSAYELAMERLEKKEPTKKLTNAQKERIAEINSLYGSKIAEKETFLQGEITKETAKGDLGAIAQLQDQLAREVRRLHSEWEEKKAAVHGETKYESDIKRAEDEGRAPTKELP